MTFVVVYDANVLYPSTLLIHVALAGLVQAKWDVEAKHPDDFLVDQFHLDASAIHRTIESIADSWKNPPGTNREPADRLVRERLTPEQEFGPSRITGQRTAPRVAIRHGRVGTPQDIPDALAMS